MDDSKFSYITELGPDGLAQVVAAVILGDVEFLSGLDVENLDGGLVLPAKG
jgi:hypothetical protein